MDTISKNYIGDQDQQRLAVQIDIRDFEKIEIFKDYALSQLMEKNDPEETLHFPNAKK